MKKVFFSKATRQHREHTEPQTQPKQQQAKKPNSSNQVESSNTYAPLTEEND